jgi:hypothetical protein
MDKGLHNYVKVMRGIDPPHFYFRIEATTLRVYDHPCDAPGSIVY